MPNQTGSYVLSTAGSTPSTGIANLAKSSDNSMTFFSVSGTYTTTSIKFEGTVDGTNWFPVGAIQETDLTVVTGTISLSDSTTRCFQISSAGFSNVRLYVVAIATGALDVYALATNIIAVPITVSNTTANATISGNTAIAGTMTVTSADAKALAVGRLGATTPAFQVDASTGTSITGIKVKAAGTGGGVAISSIGETNVALTIDAQGSGTITIAGTSTGAVTITPATTITGALTCSSTLSCTALTATSIAATGTVALTNNMTITDAKNIVLASGTGTKFGTATTQKLAFYGVAPAAQPAANADVTTSASGSVNTVFLNTTFTGGGTAAYSVGGIVLSLKALGLLAT